MSMKDKKTNEVSKEDEDFERLCDSFDKPDLKVLWDSATINEDNSHIVDVNEIFPELKRYRYRG